VACSPDNARMTVAACCKLPSCCLPTPCQCVVRKVVNGKRAPDGFSGRALPHFPRGTRTPEGKGFVAASFYRCRAISISVMSLNFGHITMLMLARVVTIIHLHAADTGPRPPPIEQVA